MIPSFVTYPSSRGQLLYPGTGSVFDRIARTGMPGTPSISGSAPRVLASANAAQPYYRTAGIFVFHSFLPLPHSWPSFLEGSGERRGQHIDVTFSLDFQDA